MALVPLWLDSRIWDLQSCSLMDKPVIIKKYEKIKDKNKKDNIVFLIIYIHINENDARCVLSY